MSIFSSILKNTMMLVAGRMGGKILGAIFIAFLARAVGPAGVGKWAFAGSVVAIFMILPNFGFDTLLVRDIAKLRHQGKELIQNILYSKLLLAIFVFFLLICFSMLKQYNNQTIQIIVFVFLSAILSSILQTFNSIFRSFEKMEYEALSTVFRSVMIFLFGVSAIKLGLKLNGIILALVIGDIITVSIGFYIIRRNFMHISPKINTKLIKKIIKAAIPFGLLTIVEIVLVNTDNLMIARFEGEIAVGWYSAALKLLMILIIVPDMFMNSIFPVLSRLSLSSCDSLRETYYKSFSYMLFIAFPMAVGGFLVSDQTILIIYGEQFRNSILIFQVMIWVLMFSFVGFVNGATLCATGRERIFALLQGCAAVLNIFLDYILIKRFGYIGACYATLIIVALGFIIYSTICHRQLSVQPDLLMIGKSLAASILMGIVIFILKELLVNVFILIPIGAVIYFALTVLLRTLPKEDTIALRALAYRHSP